MLYYRSRGLAPVFLGARQRKPRGVVVAARLFDAAFVGIYAVLCARLVVEVVRAKWSSGVVALVARLSGPFYSPFRDTVPTTTALGASPVAWSLVVALVVYAVVHAVIRTLLREVARSG